MSYSTNWLPLRLDISDNMSVVIVCYPVCDINFEIDLSFLIKLFSYMTKITEQKFKYFKNQKRF